MRRLFATIVIGLSTWVSAEDPGPASAAIRQLISEAQSHPAAASEKFWKSLEAAHAPLIETLDGDPTHLLVTFVWRGAPDTKLVLLGGSVEGTAPHRRLLTQVPGTDVWYKSMKMRSDTRISYAFGPNIPLEPISVKYIPALIKRASLFRADPLNPVRSGLGSLLELKDAPKQPWLELNEAAAKGTMTVEAKFASKILGNARDLSVYTPVGYSAAGAPYPTVYLFDRGAYQTLIPVPRILDNLIHAKAIPQVVAVLIDNPQALRMKELGCDPDFVEFLALELVPFVRSKYHVSADPARTVIGGSSLGGLSASYAAFQHPEIFGAVLSQSGSYWWSKDWDFGDIDVEVEGEWLTRQFAISPPRAIRFYLDVGFYEGEEPSMAIVNRHFRDVLEAKGYTIVRYLETSSAHEYIQWRGTIGNALIDLLK